MIFYLLLSLLLTSETTDTTRYHGIEIPYSVRNLDCLEQAGIAPESREFGTCFLPRNTVLLDHKTQTWKMLILANRSADYCFDEDSQYVLITSKEMLLYRDGVVTYLPNDSACGMPLPKAFIPRNDYYPIQCFGDGFVRYGKYYRKNGAILKVGADDDFAAAHWPDGRCNILLMSSGKKLRVCGSQIRYLSRYKERYGRFEIPIHPLTDTTRFYTNCFTFGDQPTMLYCRRPGGLDSFSTPPDSTRYRLNVRWYDSLAGWRSVLPYYVANQYRSTRTDYDDYHNQTIDPKYACGNPIWNFMRSFPLRWNRRRLDQM